MAALKPAASISNVPDPSPYMPQPSGRDSQPLPTAAEVKDMTDDKSGVFLLDLVDFLPWEEEWSAVADVSLI